MGLSDKQRRLCQEEVAENPIGVEYITSGRTRWLILECRSTNAIQLQSLRLSCVLSNVVIAAVQKLSFLMLFAFIIAAIYSANKRRIYKTALLPFCFHFLFCSLKLFVLLFWLFRIARSL